MLSKGQRLCRAQFAFWAGTVKAHQFLWPEAHGAAWLSLPTCAMHRLEAGLSTVLIKAKAAPRGEPSTAHLPHSKGTAAFFPARTAERACPPSRWAGSEGARQRKRLPSFARRGEGAAPASCLSPPKVCVSTTGYFWKSLGMAGKRPSSDNYTASQGRELLRASPRNVRNPHPQEELRSGSQQR